MTIFQKNNSQPSNNIDYKESELIAVRVKDIILDITHPFAKMFGGYDAIGTINFTPLDKDTPLEAPWVKGHNAVPFFSFIKQYPLKNEIVLLLKTYNKDYYKKTSRTFYYLPNINMWKHPHHNALPTLKGMKNEKTSQDYIETDGGLTRQVTDGSTEIMLGRYFKEQLNIKPLLPYEGDTILEGRFGNSIRLGSTSKEKKLINFEEQQVIPTENKNRWSNEGETGDPIVIIRNGQTPETNNKGWEHIVEDIDDDDSSIYLTSTQQLTNFTPASENKNSYHAS